MNTYAIAEPTYPTKIKFDDLDEKINRREDIDEKFLKKTLEIFQLNHLH